MTKPLLLSYSILFATTQFAFSQKKNAEDRPYFAPAYLNTSPVKESVKSTDRRTLFALIGEDFIILPTDVSSGGFFAFHYTNKPNMELSNKDVAGKHLKLIGINSKYTEATFADSNGDRYTKGMIDSIIPGFIPLSEIQTAERIYNNTTWWLQRPALKVALGNKRRSASLWEPLKIVKVSISDVSYAPVRLTFKTQLGELGTADVDISGTNTINHRDLSIEALRNRTFKSLLTDVNPKQGYKLSPAMWKIVEKGTIYLGMPSKAFEVMVGKPNHINTTTGFFGVHEQWVYGNSYYYFENGKLTTVQN